MAKKPPIKSVSQLPSWFSINKYIDANKLSPFNWYQQLSFRYFLYVCLDSENSRNISYYIRKIETHGIIPSSDKILTKFGSSPQYNTKQPYNTISVSSLPRAEAYMFANDLHDDPEAQRMHDAYNRLQLTKEEEEQWHEPYDLYTLRMGISNEGLANIVIDLNASNEQLVSDFRHWLTEFRKFTPYSFKEDHKNFSDAQFQKWAANRVLLYIDLDLWSKHHNLIITNHVLGEAIFGDIDNIDPTEKIIKTTKPLAMKLMCDEAIAKLNAQIRKTNSNI